MRKVVRQYGALAAVTMAMLIVIDDDEPGPQACTETPTYACDSTPSWPGTAP